jgi:hypothetical protein
MISISVLHDVACLTAQMSIIASIHGPDEVICGDTCHLIEFK